MAIGFRDHGLTTGSAVLAVASGTATGSVTVYPWRERFLKTQVVIEVDAAAGWGGTVTITPSYRTEANAAAATSVSVGDLVGAGTAKTYVTTIAGPVESLAIAVTGNDKVLRVYALSYGQVEMGAL